MAHRDDIQFDDVGDFQQGIEPLEIHKVVEGDLISDRGQLFQTIHDVRSHLDCFKNFQNHAVFRHRFAVARSQNQVPVEIDKCAAGSDHNVETDFNEGIGNDFSCGGITIGKRGAVLAARTTKKKFVAKYLHVAVIDGL